MVNLENKFSYERNLDINDRCRYKQELEKESNHLLRVNDFKPQRTPV